MVNRHCLVLREAGCFRKAPPQALPAAKATETGNGYKGRLRDAAIALPILIAAYSLGLCCYYHSFFEELPIMKRKRMFWYDAECDEAVSFAETWMSIPQKPIFAKEAPPTIMVQKILDRLPEVELAKNLVIKLYVCDVYEEPNSHALNGTNGGMHEKEADHIGLILMAKAGTDPQTRIDQAERLSIEQNLTLEGREPMPEFLSTSSENRIKFMKAVLPDTKAFFEQRKGNPLQVEEWDEVSELVQRRLAIVSALGFRCRSRPDQVLPAIVGELSRIAEAMVELKARLDTPSSSGEVANQLDSATTPPLDQLKSSP
ncbi:uncharacterized protein PAC_10732 [Phialocephala subalpina]|uniref:Uncharacterized protein n=1 Tax=Phialocephala subalpina TaxID=576137 RepID=A0A1L7X737_9HELO|nr:uncharacterized protein PAC_10732 [Phialocephala subalpina]